MIRYREYSFSSLNLQVQSCIFQKLHHIFIGKNHKKLLNINFLLVITAPKQLIHVTSISYIATALSCNKDLFAQFFIFLIETDRTAFLRCRDRRDHTRGTAFQ